MAQLGFTRAMAAGEVFDPLVNWQYRYAPRAGTFSVLLQELGSPAVVPALRATITSGSDTLMEESPLQSTDPVVVGSWMPRPDTVVPVIDAVDGGDLLKISIRNTAAGPINVAGIVEFN